MNDPKNQVSIRPGGSPAARTHSTLVSTSGKEQRMTILRSAADQQLVKPFRTHGWSPEITETRQDGEYLVITAVKKDVTRRVALMYSSATDNKYYKKLDSEVDRTFTNGELYMIESFAYGLTKPVVPVDQFFPSSSSGIRSYIPRLAGLP